MPDINIKADVKQTSVLGKVKVLVEQVVGSPSQAQISQAVADYIDSHPGALSPLSASVKAALLQIAEKVAYIDENGQSYYNALDAALSAKALLQITAVYTQSGTVYDTDSLDSLKADLVVTAYYDDGTTADVTSACTLSGTLTEGTSTITATYEGQSATFNVTVTADALYPLHEGTYTVATSTKTVGTATVTKGASATHIALTFTANTASSQGLFVNLKSGTASDKSTVVNNQSAWFSLASGSEVKISLKNVVNSSGVVFAMNFKDTGTTSLSGTGFTDSTHTSGDESNTVTMASATTVGSYFFYLTSSQGQSISGKAVEFDISLTVDGTRYF